MKRPCADKQILTMQSAVRQLKMLTFVVNNRCVDGPLKRHRCVVGQLGQCPRDQTVR
jgi:hypothetical protein